MKKLKSHAQAGVQKLIVRLGHRGAILALLSTIFFLIGIKGIFDPSREIERLSFYAFLPPWARGILWILPAIIGMYAALIGRGKDDGAGFSALMIPAVTVAGSYLVSWFIFLAGLSTYGTGWVDCIEWCAIIVVLIITSSWQEVDAASPVPNDANKD